MNARRTRRALAGAVLLVVPMTAASCSNPLDQPDRQVSAGEVVPALGNPDGQLISVETPAGRLDFLVGTARPDETPYSSDDSPGSPESLGASDGNTLVGVSYSLAIGTGWAAMLDADRPVTPVVQLVVDPGQESEHAYDLSDIVIDEADSAGYPTTLGVSGSAWVAVPGDGSDLAIAVDYDGLRQVKEVDDLDQSEGAAAMLYSRRSELGTSYIDCGAPATRGQVLDDLNGQCLVQVSKTPYVPGLGWVSSRDRAWLVVESTVRPDEPTADGGRVRVGCSGTGEMGPVTYRFEGAKPEDVEQVGPDTETHGRDRVVWETDSLARGELTLRADFARDACVVPLTWSLQVY
ncbi:hypothetical protein [Nocardioides acrostichi]|uniref:Lipoprotein n=1 Tax=Nocardioides acrostichi TaxID=2784339 RepID=A0A930USR4_9ACTN|nr:hypothetical protein [Nocardioides acrostichi]MBF4160158.1 hypothetical protein [Nocardioides acrostichi]